MPVPSQMAGILEISVDPRCRAPPLVPEGRDRTHPARIHVYGLGAGEGRQREQREISDAQHDDKDLVKESGVKLSDQVSVVSEVTEVWTARLVRQSSDSSECAGNSCCYCTDKRIAYRLPPFGCWRAGYKQPEGCKGSSRFGKRGPAERVIAGLRIENSRFVSTDVKMSVSRAAVGNERKREETAGPRRKDRTKRSTPTLWGGERVRQLSEGRVRARFK